MKKLIALLAIALPLVGQAQPPEGQDWWACQSVASSGLKYKSGEWQGTDFVHDARFVLIADGEKNLDTESAAKAMFVILEPEDVTCTPADLFHTIGCHSTNDAVPVSMHFDKKYGNGVIYFGDGGGKPSRTSDSAVVTAFECAKG